jgi:ABC-2 type transport system ATP-binding protein
MPEDTIAVTDVHKSYGAVEALRGVSLEVEPGLVHCLAGPNGSGKSTLFRIMLGLTQPTAGTVTRPAGNVVGAGFQEPAFYGSLTVAENLDVFGALSGTPGEEWVEEVVDVFELDRVRHRIAGDLSGGFSKQLDLALGLLKRPSVLLLDEPLADLDDLNQRSLLAFLREYAAAGNAVVISSHRIDELGPAIDRLTVVYDGEITREQYRSDDENQAPIGEVYRETIDRVSD